MAKLGEHLFELDPLKIAFTIDPDNNHRFQMQTFKMPVTSFSEMPKRQLEFLAKYNYSSDSGEKVLVDSDEGMHMKMREKKANRKIIGSIDKIKAMQGKLKSIEGLLESPARGIQSLLLRQNKLLKIIHAKSEEDPTAHDLSDLAIMQRV